MIQAAFPDGSQGSPKGLRHGFGIDATVNASPLHMIQKWMGHTQRGTAAIYADVAGKAGRGIAARMWG